MNFWIILLIIICVVGIIFISSKSPQTKKTREDRLQELAKLLESKLEPLENHENSHKIIFYSKDRSFQFEEIEDRGFTDKKYKGFLKTQTESNLSLGFTEKPRSTIRSVMVKASDMDEPINAQVHVPKELKQFEIFTNHPNQINVLFVNDYVLDILKRLYHMDPHGHPVMPLRIQDGLISVEFFSTLDRKPNIYDLHHNIHLIERYIADVSVIAKAVEELKDRKN